METSEQKDQVTGDAVPVSVKKRIVIELSDTNALSYSIHGFSSEYEALGAINAVGRNIDKAIVWNKTIEDLAGLIAHEKPPEKDVQRSELTQKLEEAISQIRAMK